MKIKFLIIVVFILMSGCSKMMLLQTDNEKDLYKSLKVEGKSITRYPSTKDTSYYIPRIQVGDNLLIEYINQPITEEVATVTKEYFVNNNGEILLPLLGKVKVEGYTTYELIDTLEKKYSDYYVDPRINVINKSMKVYVFGEFAKTGAISLPHERMHLIEVIGLAGGVNNFAKLDRLKIIRGDLRKPKIIWVDLTKQNILKSQELIVQNGDIIYLRPKNIALFTRNILPWLQLSSIISTIGGILVIYFRLQSFR